MESTLSQDEIVAKLTASLATRLTSSLESMLGAAQRCKTIPEPLEASAGEAGKDYLGWSALFTSNPKIQFRIFANTQSWNLLGKTVLEAAGLDEFDEATLKGTYTETLAQAASSWAQDLSSLAGTKWDLTSSHLAGLEGRTPYAWGYEFPIGDASAKLAVHLSDELLQALSRPVESIPAIEQKLSQEPNLSQSHFELLLDVELPVSVSFGRALVPLKEILKLNSGSIVELNRALTEPVEVIVNNCVIARGEVVVVEGNYGVRIQQIISRQDRLRTVN